MSQDNPKPTASLKSIEQFTQELERLINASNNIKIDVREANAEEISELETIRAEYEREQLNRLIDDNDARKNFSRSIFCVTIVWMFLVLAIVVAYGRGFFRFPDAVVITLITTTTANVFGFLYVVVNYLFNKSKST